MPSPGTQEAMALMAGFAERTGLSERRDGATSGPTPSRSATSSDSPAQTGDARYVQLARQLVDRVHHMLGRHRATIGARAGSAASASATARPTPPAAGCGSASRCPSAGRTSPSTRRWSGTATASTSTTSRSGCTPSTRSRARPESRSFSLWARELAADRARRLHLRGLPGRNGRRMYWKMSIDSPVRWCLHGTARPAGRLRHLPAAAARPRPGCRVRRRARPRRRDARLRGDDRRPAVATGDPLGIGGLLTDASRVEQLMPQGALRGPLNCSSPAHGRARGARSTMRRSEEQAPAGRTGSRSASSASRSACMPSS